MNRDSRVTSSIEVLAHAKINVALRVLARRDDGFHDVETLIVPVDLSDRVEVAAADRLEVSLSGPFADRVAGANLASRAVVAIAEREGREPTVRVRIDKRIPVGAGLGGGSADAAATLRATAALWGVPDDHASLVRLAAGLGSDVPALLHGGAVLASGRGERLTPIRAATSWWVVRPFGFQVRAADAYAWWDASGTSGADLGVGIAALEAGNVDALAESLANDLQGPVVEHHPEIGVTIAALLEGGGLGAIVTGSGPTVVALARDAEQAAAVAASVPGSFTVSGPPEAGSPSSPG